MFGDYYDYLYDENNKLNSNSFVEIIDANATMINGRKIKYFEVFGTHKGPQGKFKTIKETYNFIQKRKKEEKLLTCHRETKFIVYIIIDAENCNEEIYGYFKIRKLKNGYKVLKDTKIY